MADSLDTLPLVDNSYADAGLNATPAPKTITQGITGQEPPSRKLNLEPGVIDQNKDDELSIDDPDSVYKDEKDATKTTTKKLPASTKPTEAKPKEEQRKDSDSDKLADEGFNLELGIEEEVEKKDEPQKKSRDYSDVTEEQKEILKHIPNYLLDKAKAYIKQVDVTKKELADLKVEYDKVKSGKLPDNYYEHEKAYLLHPDYEKLQQTQSFIDFEEDHYSKQLIAAKSGQEWYELTGYKDGEPQFKTHKTLEGNKPDIQAEIGITKYLNTLGNKRAENNQKLGSLTSEFKSNNDLTKKAYTEIDQKYFNKISDVSKLPEEAKNYYNQALKYLEEKLPTFKGHKFLDWFAKAALSDVYKNQLTTKLKNEVKTLKGMKADELEAGPTSKVLSGAASGNTKGEVIYDMNNLEKDF